MVSTRESSYKDKVIEAKVITDKVLKTGNILPAC